MNEPLPAALSVVACVPVEAAAELMPDFLARSTYSTYEIVPCPACSDRMYLGERGKRAVAAGLATMLCMACVARTHGLHPDNMFKLTDLDGK